MNDDHLTYMDRDLHNVINKTVGHWNKAFQDAYDSLSLTEFGLAEYSYGYHLLVRISRIEVGTNDIEEHKAIVVHVIMTSLGHEFHLFDLKGVLKDGKVNAIMELPYHLKERLK